MLDMPSAVLYFLYGAVMGAGLFCYVRAYQTRLDTPVHKRWGLTGASLSLGGILVVLLGFYAFGWTVNERVPEVVRVHRVVALAAAAMLILTAVTGMARHKLHPRLYLVFLPLYVIALLTAAIGYGP